ncbi:B12-binding domain-containing radical SAM protein [Hydrogeniiclostridium mannosilyticum]|uniref:B12-binding domain-containing radical SAM protein n=1 Tax=Hydrogeniiclostridium mannosilyticum TaxID=2764322 RepID=UPI0018AAF40E
MKAVFIYLTTNPQGDEHLGTASIASYLEHHNIAVELKIIVYDPQNFCIENIIDEIPSSDIIGFPIYNTNALVIYDVAHKLKERFPKILISVGGPLATDAADEILRDCTYIDLVVLGDGEEPYLQLIESIESKMNIEDIPYILTQKDKNHEIKKPHVVELEKLPWVSRQYLEQMIKRGFGTARLTAARGCCANCSFCSHNSYTKSANKHWRGRNIYDVFNEVIYLYKTYGIQSFTFNDGSFEDPGRLGKDRIREFCKLVISSGHRFHFWAFLRAETFSEKDVPLIKLMREAGFTEVFIGVESQNEADLKIYNKRATPQNNIESLKLFKKCGINVLFGFIMFNPVSTLDSLKENYIFLREENNWRPHAFVGKVAIYYKTDLHYICMKLNVLKDDFSYLNPFAYRFIDKNVAQIWDFIEDNLLKSIIFEKYDFDLFYFNNYMNNLLALFPNETLKYTHQFQNILTKVSTLLSAYFYNLFYIQDFQKAIQDISNLEKNMAKYILELNSLKIKMILHEPFRSYIRQLNLKSKEK